MRHVNADDNCWRVAVESVYACMDASALATDDYLVSGYFDPTGETCADADSPRRAVFDPPLPTDTLTDHWAWNIGSFTLWNGDTECGTITFDASRTDGSAAIIVTIDGESALAVDRSETPDTNTAFYAYECPDGSTYRSTERAEHPRLQPASPVAAVVGDDSRPAAKAAKSSGAAPGTGVVNGAGMLRSLIALATLLPLAACVDDGLETDASALGDGTPEAIGVLRFLNGPAADVATLDVAAALDARAAKNIVAHVRGADGLLGTGDDDPIADLAELDGIAQVGPATIDRLVAYVDSIGGIPRITLEGVMLTQAEADAILAAARGATQAELDDAAALDARAATNIVAARPLADLAAVGAVPYVGATAIEKLRRWAPTWHGAPAPTCDPVVMQSLRACIDTAIAEQMIALPDAVGYCTVMPEYETCLDRFADEYASLCRADNDCIAPERCWGTPNDGSSVLGVCGTTAAETGEFDVDVPVAVSAAAGESATSVVVVRGLRTVPDVVSVEVDLDGVDARRVRLELTDANEGTSLLWDGATATSATLPGSLTPGPGIYYDDYVNGDWTLRVTTLGAGTAGTIASWRLRITSRWD